MTTEPAGPLGLVTVTFSPGDALRGLLDSIPGAGARPVRIVLADNGSVDGSVEAAAERPDVTLVRTGANLGYGAAVNRGMAALDQTIGFVLVVNPDVVLGPGSLDELVAVADRWPRAGAVGPLITTADGTVYPSARRLPSIGTGIGHATLGWIWPTNPWTKSYRADHTAPVERPAGWLSGACLLVRREAFDAVGGFDPGYFMYFEDVDLGARLADAGWQNVYAPSAAVVHTGGHAAALVPQEMAAAHHRSAYRYLASRYPRHWQAPLRWVLKAGLAGRAALARRVGRIRHGAALPGGPQ